MDYTLNSFKSKFNNTIKEPQKSENKEDKSGISSKKILGIASLAVAIPTIAYLAYHGHLKIKKPKMPETKVPETKIPETKIPETNPEIKTKQNTETTTTKAKQQKYSGLTATTEKPSAFDPASQLYSERTLYKNSKGKVMKEVRMIDGQPSETILYDGKGNIRRKTTYVCEPAHTIDSANNGNIKSIEFYKNGKQTNNLVFYNYGKTIHYNGMKYEGFENKDIPEILRVVPTLKKYDKLSKEELLEKYISELSKDRTVESRITTNYMAERYTAMNKERITSNLSHHPKEGDEVNAYILGKKPVMGKENKEYLDKCIADNDKMFSELPPTEKSGIRFRGERYHDNEATINRYNELLNLKEGDTFENVGYSWFSNSPAVFNGYGRAGNGGNTGKGVRHIIEIPQGSTHVEESFGGVGGIEGTTDRNARFECLKKIVDKDGNLTIFSRYISPQ